MAAVLFWSFGAPAKAGILAQNVNEGNWICEKAAGEAFPRQYWPADWATQVFAQNLVLNREEQKTVSENSETGGKRKYGFCATRRPLAAKHGSLTELTRRGNPRQLRSGCGLLAEWFLFLEMAAEKDKT